MESHSDNLRMQAAFSAKHPDATFHETSGEVVGPRWAEWKSFKDGWMARAGSANEEFDGAQAYHLGRAEYEVATKCAGPLFGNISKYDQAEWIARAVLNRVFSSN